MLFNNNILTLALILSLTTTTSALHIKSRNHAQIIASQRTIIDSSGSGSESVSVSSINNAADTYNSALKRAQQDGRISVSQFARSQIVGGGGGGGEKRQGGGDQKRVLRKKSGSCKIRSTAGSEGLVSTSSSSANSAEVTPSVTESVSVSSTAVGSATSVTTPPVLAHVTTSTTDWYESTSSSSDWVDTTSTSSTWTAAPTSAPGNAAGLLQISDSACGACPSTSQTPNGPEWWLNCNIDGSGWNPPHVTINQLVAADLHSNGVFSACAQYIDQFNQAGADTGVPPIMLASFAMQESSCNAGALGKNGEISLMQITPANCPSGVNCWDPYTNIKVGSQLFKSMVDAAGGNALAAIGAYNGWYVGMTVGDANSAHVCSQRNNLDYLTQFTNGWMQGKSAEGLGSYNNVNC